MSGIAEAATQTTEGYRAQFVHSECHAGITVRAAWLTMIVFFVACSSGTVGGSGVGGGATDAGTVVTINFDELPQATVVGTQYAPRVTFSGSGQVLAKQWRTDTQHSTPNFVCVANCVGDLTIDFGQPVNGVHFRMIGVDTSGSAATLKVTARGLMTTQPITGAGSFTQPLPVDLSNKVGVTRLEIVSVTDPYGVGFDDLVFTVP